MAKEVSALAAVAALFLLCRYSSAQGCSPAPPNTLISGGPPGVLRTNNVPTILPPNQYVPVLTFRPVIGGHGTDPWAVFSETQVRQHGLWCQVQEASTNNMANNNIGDWYYPTPSGLIALDNISNDSTPYQELKCDNQVGLVVDGDIMNNQGIVRCTTNITGLIAVTGVSTDTNYLGVYEDSVITIIRNSGPVVESNMTLTLLHTRDVGIIVQFGINVHFRLSFNVSLGLPSFIECTRDSIQIHRGRGFVSGVNYEVVRPLYVNTSQPEITRVSFEQTQSRVGATYSCTVYVEGRTNIAPTTGYNHDQLGSATSTATITVAGRPTGVTATRNGYNSVLVSWTAPLPAPAGYEVFHQTTSDDTRLSVGNTTSTMMTVTGLTLGVTYYIFVVSFGAEGALVLPSAHGNAPAITLSTQIPQLSGTPILNANTTSIMVSWTHPQFFPDSYTVSYSCQLLCDSQTPSVVQTKNTVIGTANNHIISSLNAGSSCSVSVTAMFVNGNSNTITFSTNTLTAAPTGSSEVLNSISVESRSLSVVWGTVPCEHQGGPITGYRLRYSNGTSIVNTTGEGSRHHMLTGLTPFTNYSVQVAAMNNGGTGPYSDPALTVETLQDVPGAVVNLTVYTSVTEFTLSWSPPLELNGVIIVYEVCSDSTILSCTNTSATNNTLMNIPPETSVSIAVRAYTIIGPGENVTVENSTESVPIVSDVSATALNSTSVMVSWTPVNLTVMYHYTVNYTTMGVVNGTVTFPSTVSSGVVSGLQGGQQYQFSVTVTLNISGELYTGSHNNTQQPITLPLPPVPSSTLFISSSEGITTSISLANVIPSSSFSSSSLQPSSTSKTSPVNSTSPLPATAAAIVVLLILAIIVAVVITIIIVIIRKRKEPKSFAVHYLKEGPKVDQTVNEQLYVTVASKPYFELFPDDDSVIEGKKVLLPVKIIGSPQPTLTWYHEKTHLGNDYAHEISSDGSLTIITAEMRHSGTYRLVATNSEGTVEKQFSLKVITEEDEEPPLATAAKMIKSRPVPVAEFGQYVSQNHANGNKGFSSLYTSLESGESDHPVTVGLNPANKPLNRFNNITVYDDNRIVLKPLSDCQNDYINASYVDGYESFHKFIACQGPLKKTLTDFWRMIWQENVHTIAMVTNLKESNKIKCQQYWPDNGSKNFGPFIVTTTDQLMCADYIVRLLQVELTEGSNFPRMITQYHFTSWPDHDVPEYATSILAYHRRIKKDYNPSQGPIVVHCSAGVGRTGTLIAIDTLLQQVEKAKIVDVCGVITKMRHQRMKMVQTTNQFAFIHDVILESVTCGDTQINSGDLRFTIAQMRTKQKETGKTGFEIQFEILNQVTPNPSEVKVLTAAQSKNMNRSMKFLPPDKHRIQLKGVLPDYIHATFVNGYKHKKAFIVAQNPMESTTKDFWKMVKERECTVVVMLCGLEENGQEMCHQYWPSTGIQNYGDLLVGTTQENKCDGYTQRVLSIRDQSGKTQHQVTQFHIRNWNTQGKCSNPQTIITVIEEIYKVQRRTDNKPIVVHCSDTVSRSGMFCAIATTIDCCKTESVVDVFQVVKAQRIQKPGLVLTVDQFQFVFEAVLTFLESFETYSNFK